MSDSGEKTEKASPKKIQDSREKGQLPPKKSANDAFTLGFGLCLLFGLNNLLANYLQTTLIKVIDHGYLGIETALEYVESILVSIAAIVFTFSGVLAIGTILFAHAMNGFNFSIDPLKPDIKKVDPVSGLKNLISPQSIVNLVRMLFFFMILAGCLLYLLFWDLHTTIGNIYCGTACIVAEITWKLQVLAVIAMLTQTTLAAIDIKMQVMMFLKKLKMTKDEVKRESKETNGNPVIKRRRQSIAQEDAQAPTFLQANYVIYSAQHLVAIIDYEDQRRLPLVVMKAGGENVKRFLFKYRATKAKMVYEPKVAKEFFEMAVIQKSLPPRSGSGMAIVQSKTKEV